MQPTKQGENVSPEFRMSDEQFERLNRTLAVYKGTHNYHNFTSGKHFNDPSSSRFIMDMKAAQPFVRNGVEFVVIAVLGQSFMIHQVCRFSSPPE